MKAIKSRLAAMNFLEFAVWGAYLTSLAQFSFPSESTGINRLVLFDTRHRVDIHACHHRHHSRPLGSRSENVEFLSCHGRRFL